MKSLVWLYSTCSIIGIFVLSIEAYEEQSARRSAGKCEPLTIPMCKGHVPYNQTLYPSHTEWFTGHNSQAEAEPEINNFLPLVETGCSSKLRFFLCVTFAPVCTVLEEPIPPCRQLCLDALQDCDAASRRIGFLGTTPSDCMKLPTQGLCIQSPADSSDAATTPSLPTTQRETVTRTTTAAPPTQTQAPSSGFFKQDCKCDCSCTCPKN
uniref:FzCRD-1 n=1 Tax=Platynereis dumerilii TaxID=6359 RepID=A0A0U2UXS3_PLADU|nr:FzCRD-1 [Platynereis dumerilii]